MNKKIASVMLSLIAIMLIVPLISGTAFANGEEDIGQGQEVGEAVGNGLNYLIHLGRNVLLPGLGTLALIYVGYLFLFNAREKEKKLLMVFLGFLIVSTAWSIITSFLQSVSG